MIALEEGFSEWFWSYRLWASGSPELNLCSGCSNCHHCLQEVNETTEIEIDSISKWELCCWLRSVFRRCKTCFQIGGWHLRNFCEVRWIQLERKNEAANAWNMQASVCCSLCDGCLAQGCNEKYPLPLLCPKFHCLNPIIWVMPFVWDNRCYVSA